MIDDGLVKIEAAVEELRWEGYEEPNYGEYHLRSYQDEAASSRSIFDYVDE